MTLFCLLHTYIHTYIPKGHNILSNKALNRGILLLSLTPYASFVISPKRAVALHASLNVASPTLLLLPLVVAIRNHFCNLKPTSGQSLSQTLTSLTKKLWWHQTALAYFTLCLPSECQPILQLGPGATSQV